MKSGPTQRPPGACTHKNEQMHMGFEPMRDNPTRLAVERLKPLSQCILLFAIAFQK